jgi:VIT1/CCC1 family predicted Fe2+/Mn2+ transporter
VLTGLAGLVAGAFSMGTGEYVSVTNQNELVHAEVALEADMHARFPQQEYDELVDRFQAYGADTNTAQRMATAVSNDPEQALRVHTRDALGVDPDDLPSPMLAGGASFAAFSLGAVLPLVPYLLGVQTLIPSLVLTAIALLAGGMTVGTLTGRPLLRSGARQLLLGALAVAAHRCPHDLTLRSADRARIADTAGVFVHGGDNIGVSVAVFASWRLRSDAAPRGPAVAR